MSNQTFRCSQCNEHKPITTGSSAGFAQDDKGNKICYACCAIQDKQWMKDHNTITLYLTIDNPHRQVGFWSRGKITNWPGTLEYQAHIRKGYHNWAGVQYSVWFKDDTGQVWYGRQVGNDTQLCHCRKIKGIIPLSDIKINHYKF